VRRDLDLPLVALALLAADRQLLGRRGMKIEARVPPARTHPWLLQRGYRAPYDKQYYRKWGDGKNQVLKDLNQFEAKLKLLSGDAVWRIQGLRVKANRLVPGLNGGAVEGDIDIELGIRYRAELIRRQEMS
jgi:hypothetical protein